MSSVTSFKPRTHTLIKIIRALAKDSENVFLSDHASDQMADRGITRPDVLRALRIGDIVGEIEAGKTVGEWKCKVVERRKNARDIGVATIVIGARRLFVKTAEWEDMP